MRLEYATDKVIDTSMHTQSGGLRDNLPLRLCRKFDRANQYV